MRRSRSPRPAPAADLVLRGGPVLVLDAADSRAEAIAVAGGEILSVGGAAEVSRHVGPGTRVVELEGRAVLPGINDSHVHAAWLGARWPHTFFGSGHREGARVEGVLAGDRAARRAALLRAGRLLSELGVTSYTEPGIGPGEAAGETGCFGPEVLEVYRELAAEGELLQRVTLLGLYGVLDGPSRLEEVSAGIERLATAQGASDPRRLRVAGLKVFADLIPLTRGAWTRHAYDDGGHGGLLVEGSDLAARAEALREMVRRGHRAGLQVGVHATGDLAIQAVLDAVAGAAGEPDAPPAADPRHYVIHGDLAEPAQLARLAELGMLYNTQAEIPAYTAGGMAQVLGEEVAAAAWPLERALEEGVLVLSSDAPILAPDWRCGIRAAERRILAGGGAPDAASRRRRLHGLLRAYTAMGAVQDAAEAWKGTLEAGKAADLVVLGGDPYAAGAEGLPGVPVEMTVLGGRVVHERSRPAPPRAPVRSAAGRRRRRGSPP